MIIKGTSTKQTKKVETVADYLRKEFANGGKRLGFEKFVKNVSKWDNEHDKVMANTIPSFADIQTACFIVASERKAEGEFIPVFDATEDKKSGVVKSVSYDDEIFARYYDTNKEGNRQSFDPVKLIKGLLSSEKYADYWTKERLNDLSNFIELMK